VTAPGPYPLPPPRPVGAGSGGRGRQILLSLSPAEAQAVVAARDQLGRLTSCAEMSTYASLRPDRLDSVTDLIYFG